MQDIWRLPISWEEELPTELVQRLFEWYNGLSALEGIRLTRKLRSKNIDAVRGQLRVFTDASSTEFGVVIYQCTYYKDGSVEVAFVVSKTRVASLKQRTIPELELKGACEGVDFMKTVITELNMNIIDVTFHTETVLKWIQSKNGKLSVFVGNRIGKIHRETAVNQWHHIPVSHNPADWCSRGINPTDVETVTAFHRGPDYLQQRLDWPKSDRHIEDEDEIELCVAVLETEPVKHVIDVLVNRNSN